MLRVGLTGGIACGKSAVAEMLVQRGAHLLSADTLAHQLYAPGSAVYDELVRRFGPAIVGGDGRILRKQLANAAFPDRVRELNAVVHPAVIAAQNRWMQEVGRADPRGVAVVEAALIFEAGADTDFDKLVVVTCAAEQKAERFAHRTGLPPEEARAEVDRRSAVQLSDQEKARRADFVIDNSGSLDDLQRQVEIVWEQLQALAAPPKS